MGLCSQKLERWATATKPHALRDLMQVECSFPYHYSLPALMAGKSSTAREIKHLLINSFPGGVGELGFACDSRRIEEFRQTFVEKTLHYATSLGCSFVHVMAGK